MAWKTLCMGWNCKSSGKNVVYSFRNEYYLNLVTFREILRNQNVRISLTKHHLPLHCNECCLCWYQSPQLFPRYFPSPSLVFIAKPAQRKKKTWVQVTDRRSPPGFGSAFNSSLINASLSPNTMPWAQSTPRGVPWLCWETEGEGVVAGSVYMSVYWVGDHCFSSKSLSLFVLQLTRRYLKLKSALLLNFLLSMLTGGFWMVFAYLSSPLLLRGYLVLTAWHLLGFRSLNEREAKQGKIFWHNFIIDMVVL